MGIAPVRDFGPSDYSAVDAGPAEQCADVMLGVYWVRHLWPQCYDTSRPEYPGAGVGAQLGDLNVSGGRSTFWVSHEFNPGVFCLRAAGNAYDARLVFVRVGTAFVEVRYGLDPGR